MKNTRLKEIEERLKEFCLANKVEKKGDFDPVEKLVRVIEEIDSNYL